MTKVAANTSLGIRKLFKSKFSDMKGYTFRVAALAYPPYLMKNGDKYSGYEILQLEAMGSMLNFTYQTIEPPDGQWGTAGPNGTWTGLIGHSLYGHTNWSMGMLSLTEDREAVIDFSTPFYFDGISFMAPLPKELPKYLAIFKPFLGQVWAFVIFSGPLYWLILVPTEERQDHVSDPSG